MNRQQPHAAVESEKKKIQTEKDRMPCKIWYKDLWWKFKKQAKKVANSNADADSSSDESISNSDKKQMICHKSQMKSIKIRATKRPSDSTRNKLEENFVSDENLIFPSSEVVKIESWEKVSYSKMLPATDVLLHLRSPKQINFLPEEVRRKFINRSVSIKSEDSLLDFKLLGDIRTTSEKTAEKLVEASVTNLKKLMVDITATSEKTAEKLVEASVTNLKKLMVDITATSEKTAEKLVEDSLAYLKKLMVDITTTSEKTVEKLEEVLKNNTHYEIHDSLANLKKLMVDITTTGTSKMTENLVEFFENDILDLNADSLANLKKLMVDITTTGTSKMTENLVEFFENDILDLNALIIAASDKRTFDFHCTRRPSDYKGNKFKKFIVSVENLALQTSKGVEVNHVSQKRDECDKIIQLAQASMILGSYCMYTNPLTPAVSSYPSIPNQNRNNEERRITEGNENENVAENHQENEKRLVTSQNSDTLTTLDQNRNNEERRVTEGNENENVAENHQENEERLVTSQNLDTLTTLYQIHNEIREAIRWMLKQILSMSSDDLRHKSTEASEGSANRPIHHTGICSYDLRTTLDSQEDNSTGMPGSMIIETNTDASSDEFLSTVESTAIRLYRDVIRNETFRMMSSINRVVSEAVHLFGFERSQIFFDLLLDEELCQFESAGAISEFVPNMVESTVRQNVMSFFEHAQDMMNILMTLLLRCPDRNILQQMPVQHFTSLIKSVIESSLKTKTKGREKLSLEGKIYTMVDSKDIERSLGEEIPEDVLNGLGSGDEMVVYRFVDTRLETHQLSDRRDNRPIHSIYFPSDCRLFIYIPTENGSYWHQLDMRRADRIRRHSR